MPFTQTQAILYIILFAMHISVYAIGSYIIFSRRKEQRDRTRIILGTFFTCVLLCIIHFMVTKLTDTSIDTHLVKVLPFYTVALSFIVWSLVPIYLIEMLRPYWLTWRRFLIFIAPYVSAFFIFFIWHFISDFHALAPIPNASYLIEHLSETDVWMRVALVVMLVLYGFVVFFIPKDWRRSNAPHPWFNILAVTTCLCTFTCVIGPILYHPIGLGIHLFVVDALCCLAFYIEMRVRIPVPEHIAQTSKDEVHAAPHEEHCPDEIVEGLQALLETRVWQNPDLQQLDFCTHLSTNRTYLVSAIHALGYANYQDMINTYRVKYIHHQLEKDPSQNLLDLFFEAGFRNRNTATQAFLRLYNCLPSAYQKQRQEEAERL